MAAGEPAAGNGDAGLVDRYELLRRRVLGGEPDGFRLGLAVLQRQGVASWIRAWRDLGGFVPPSPGPAASPAAASDEVVAVLASMTLACAGAGGRR